jgi:Tol biopolymer transport system component
LILYDDLRAIHADTRALTVILPPGEGGNFAPSPDGRRIAFSTPGSLNLVNADGSGLRRDLVVFPQVVTYSEYQFYPHPFWHADSRSLAVIIPPSDPLGIPVRPTLIWRVTAEGAAEMAGQVADAVFFGGLLTLSADLGLVAYTRTAGAAEANRQELVVAGLDGSAPQVVAAGGAGSFQGVWSPLGRDLLFSGDFAPGLSLAQAGGSAVSVISDRQVAPGFRWAGAGRVVFWEREGGIWRLVLAAAGGPPEALAESDQPGAFDLFP